MDRRWDRPIYVKLTCKVGRAAQGKDEVTVGARGRHDPYICQCGLCRKGQIALGSGDCAAGTLPSMPKRPKDQIDDPAATEMQIKAGLRIQAIRKIGGVTQTKICGKLGVDQSTWSKWERGERMPDLFVMTRFAARAKTSLDLIYLGRPIGTHESLLTLLRLAIPHLLVQEPSGTVPDTDTAQASYRATIALTMAE